MSKLDPISLQFIKLRSSQPDIAIKFIMDKYGDVLYGIVLRILEDKNLAEDALQEGFVKIWRNCNDFNPEMASLFTWVLTIIKNSAIDKLRQEKKRKNQNLHPDVYNSITHSEEQQMTDSGLMQQINKLDSKYRELIDLIYLKAYTQQEVSELLNLPLGTVKTRIQSAIKMLRTVLSALVLLLISFSK